MPPCACITLEHLRALQPTLYTKCYVDVQILHVPLCSLFPGVPGYEIDADNDRNTSSRYRSHQDSQSHTNTNESTVTWLWGSWYSWCCVVWDCRVQIYHNYIYQTSLPWRLLTNIPDSKWCLSNVVACVGKTGKAFANWSNYTPWVGLFQGAKGDNVPKGNL